jgi:hypothetical protein
MVLRHAIMPAKVPKWEKQNIMKCIKGRVAVMNLFQGPTIWRVLKMQYNISSISIWMRVRDYGSNLSFSCREIITPLISV